MEKISTDICLFSIKFAWSWSVWYYVQPRLTRVVVVAGRERSEQRGVLLLDYRRVVLSKKYRWRRVEIVITLGKYPATTQQRDFSPNFNEISVRDRSLSETWVDTITKRADQAEGMEESCISVRILIVVFENNLSMLGAKANSFRGHTLTRRYWPKDNTTSIGPLHLRIQTSLSFATTTDTLLQCTWSLQI